jgi:hypothetical protein
MRLRERVRVKKLKIERYLELELTFFPRIFPTKPSGTAREIVVLPETPSTEDPSRAESLPAGRVDGREERVEGVVGRTEGRERKVGEREGRGRRLGVRASGQVECDRDKMRVALNLVIPMLTMCRILYDREQMISIYRVFTFEINYIEILAISSVPTFISKIIVLTFQVGALCAHTYPISCVTSHNPFNPIQSNPIHPFSSSLCYYIKLTVCVMPACTVCSLPPMLPRGPPLLPFIPALALFDPLLEPG